GTAPAIRSARHDRHPASHRYGRWYGCVLRPLPFSSSHCALLRDCCEAAASTRTADLCCHVRRGPSDYVIVSDELDHGQPTGHGAAGEAHRGRSPKTGSRRTSRGAWDTSLDVRPKGVFAHLCKVEAQLLIRGWLRQAHGIELLLLFAPCSGPLIRLFS